MKTIRKNLNYERGTKGPDSVVGKSNRVGACLKIGFFSVDSHYRLDGVKYFAAHGKRGNKSSGTTRRNNH